MNDANPRWQYAEGGPDNESDPYAQEPYYQQQPYGYDAYGRPLQPQQTPPQQQPAQHPQPSPHPQPGSYPDPYYQDPAQTYGGQQQGGQPGGPPPGWIPQQPQRPHYEQPQQQPQAYDTGQQPPVYDTGRQPGYQTGQQPVYDTGQHPVYDTGQHAPVYDTGQHPVYDTGRQPIYDTGRQPVYDTGQQPAYDTGQQPVHDTGQHAVYDTGRQQPVSEAGPGSGREAEAEGRPGLNYHTEQFAFLDEESEESEEVIDWLKFSESRTERREEAKRRSGNRKRGLVLLVVLALLGAGGYLWHAGKIPGLSKDKIAPVASGGAQKRDVIVVHMLPVNGGPSSTALMVDNATKGRGTTVLIPNSLQVTADDGTTTTLDKSVADGVGPTRDSLNTLLGTDIKGSWRLDSPYLELLVDSLGDVLVDTNTAIKGTGKASGTTLVPKGQQEDLTGQNAVLYATYKAPGESQTDQLARFGQVMQAVLKKMPSDAGDATRTVQGLSQILDPSLNDKQLGASLAGLAELAKTGAYDTAMLAVQKDGTLSAQSTDNVVKDVLGGNVKQSAGGTGQARVEIQDATGNAKAANIAQAAIVNGGTYVYVSGGKAASTRTLSEVLYSDPARLAAAKDVAATLGLPVSEVKKGTVPSNADITVVLGKDYKLPPSN
ncbi:transcriptional attenuator, LytR family [Streptomyces sp. DvalAA-14]|uniref:LCP family protein n=1 Tax=unclassified Streptomyces TaxID=2593676 RepID=UPI00081B8324|nr:LCP family protein [Streptomyces sp. DvalAA-14]MYS25046.1 LytR family transcriptional regulator [Streptomyces sp. SID4948]SCE51624.1 transcriptional attenuator, LytR family [Streptomyces sp. DvalAA-14]